MTKRAAKSPQFDDLVCDAALTGNAKRIRVGNRELPRPARDPRTVVVLGDTGCRIGGLTAQSCDDPAAWPFPRIVRSIAAVHPDLVVHVGDYLYRENACPPLAHCGGSPHGDDAAAWYADFLTPAAPLFAAAPVLLLRGNHEECARNGAGWFRYLDPRGTTACADATDPYEVDFGDLRIVAFDSAVAEDRKVDPDRAAVYARQFGAVRARWIEANARAGSSPTGRRTRTATSATRWAARSSRSTRCSPGTSTSSRDERRHRCRRC